LPANSAKASGNSFVPCYVPHKFRLPETLPRFGHTITSMARVLMPKASMNEDDFSMASKDEVRAAMQTSLV